MRQIVLDTETTGLDPTLGHRIIEIAAIEMINRRFSGRDFHCYVDPEREIDAGALEVHGISNDFLSDKPKFSDVANDFLRFVEGGELIIHNAPFDVGFLNAELDRVGNQPITAYCEAITDTLKMAKGLHPGKRNSLDALCDRYGVDNAARTLHGALVDTRLLAEVYLAMTRGQESLLMEMDEGNEVVDTQLTIDANIDLIVLPATPEELEHHHRQLDEIDAVAPSGCVWKQSETQTP